jgi:hypothetical protein
MNKNQKNNFIIAAFVLALLLLIRKSQNEETNLTDEQLEKSLIEPKQEALKKEPYLYDWLKFGSRGEAVKRVQMRLNYIVDLAKKYKNCEYVKYHAFFSSLVSGQMKPLKIDGIYGNKTEDFVWSLNRYVAELTTEFGEGKLPEVFFQTSLYSTRKNYYILKKTIENECK